MLYKRSETTNQAAVAHIIDISVSSFMLPTFLNINTTEIIAIHQCLINTLETPYIKFLILLYSETSQKKLENINNPNSDTLTSPISYIVYILYYSIHL